MSDTLQTPKEIDKNYEYNFAFFIGNETYTKAMSFEKLTQNSGSKYGIQTILTKKSDHQKVTEADTIKSQEELMYEYVTRYKGQKETTFTLDFAIHDMNYDFVRNYGEGLLHDLMVFKGTDRYITLQIRNKGKLKLLVTNITSSFDQDTSEYKFSLEFLMDGVNQEKLLNPPISALTNKILIRDGVRNIISMFDAKVKLIESFKLPIAGMVGAINTFCDKVDAISNFIDTTVLNIKSQIFDVKTALIRLDDTLFNNSLANLIEGIIDLSYPSDEAVSIMIGSLSSPYENRGIVPDYSYIENNVNEDTSHINYTNKKDIEELYLKSVAIEMTNSLSFALALAFAPTKALSDADKIETEKQLQQAYHRAFNYPIPQRLKSIKAINSKIIMFDNVDLTIKNYYGNVTASVLDLIQIRNIIVIQNKDMKYSLLDILLKESKEYSEPYVQDMFDLNDGQMYAKQYLLEERDNI